MPRRFSFDHCFNPLWINTTLKLGKVINKITNCFNPLWINTTLKRIFPNANLGMSFNPLWINTTLKHSHCSSAHLYVSIPYGLTLLSNHIHFSTVPPMFQSPMD